MNLHSMPPLTPAARRAQQVKQAKRALRKEPVEFRTELAKLLPDEGEPASCGLEWIDRMEAGDWAWRSPDARRKALRVMSEHANDDEVKPFDVRVRRLCRLYRAATPGQRAIIRTLLTRAFRHNLLHFARRKAVQTLRRGSRDAFRLGLLALSLEDRQHEDFRITLTLLAALYHAASKRGLDAVEPVWEVAELSGEETAKLFLGFLRRDASQQRLELFGFREGSSDGRPTLEWPASQLKD